MKRLICLLLPLLFLVGCSQTVTAQYYMMDTVMSFELRGEHAKEAERLIADEIAALETVFSPTRDDSELSRVNQLSGSATPISETFANLLQTSLSAAKETDGAFDPTLGGAIKLWRQGSVPPPETLDALVTGYETVTADQNSVTVPSGLTLDFGAVAKGYASDRAKAILEEHNIPRALLSLGGNVYAKGGGSPWIVGVRDPNGEASDWLGLLTVQDCFLVASGDYERFFESDGVRYHHILDPKTRKPAQSDLRETVIVCDSGTRADILSTAMFVKGSEGAIEFWEKSQDFDMILVTNDTVFVTKGIAVTFELTNPAYRLEVIE